MSFMSKINLFNKHVLNFRNTQIKQLYSLNYAMVVTNNSVISHPKVDAGFSTHVETGIAPCIFIEDDVDYELKSAARRAEMLDLGIIIFPEPETAGLNMPRENAYIK
jgi:hypothetical protein